MLPDIEADQFYDDMQQQQQQPEEASTESQDAEHAGRAGSLAGSDRSLTFYSSSQFPLLEESEPDQPTQRAQSTTALSRTTRVALRWVEQNMGARVDGWYCDVPRCHKSARTGAVGVHMHHRTAFAHTLQGPVLVYSIAMSPGGPPPSLVCCVPARFSWHACSIFQERLQRSADQLAVAGDGDSVNDAAGGAAGGAAADASVSFFGLIKEGRLSRNQAATLFYQVCGEHTALDWTPCMLLGPLHAVVGAASGFSKAAVDAALPPTLNDGVVWWLLRVAACCSDDHGWLCVSQPGASLW